MRLSYINTSTSLPVDDELERHLHRTMGIATADQLFPVPSDDIHEDPKFWMMLRRRRGPVQCDVLFVSQVELDQDRSDAMKETEAEEDEVDALGLYFRCHPHFGRRLIKVSPEKVMQAAADLRRRHDLALPIRALFPLLLSGIVVHEMGHLLMDDRPRPRRARHHDWAHAADRAEFPGPGARPWEWETHRRWQEKWRAMLALSWPGCDAEEYPPGRLEARHHRVVEESLCHALMLAQRLLPEERAALELFVRDSPPAYRTGLAWQMPESDLLSVMLGWRAHKHSLRDLRGRWGDLLPVTGSPADCLARQLLANTAMTRHVDLDRAMPRFVADQLPAMITAWEREGARHDAALNGGGGIYEYLCREAGTPSSGLAQAQRAAWLADWATRGETGAKYAGEFKE